MIILWELLICVTESSRGMVRIQSRYSHHHCTAAPFLCDSLGSFLLHYLCQVVDSFPGWFCHNRKMATRIFSASFLLYIQGEKLFSVIIQKAWALFWLEHVRSHICDYYTVANRKPCMCVYITCHWANHCGSDNSLKPVKAHPWIRAEISPTQTTRLLHKVR